MTQTQRTIDNLQGVHPDLQTLWHATTLPYPCQVIDGLRNFELQQQYYKTGASETLNSRHLTGHAFDFAVWPLGLDKDVSWDLVKSGLWTRAQEIKCYEDCIKALKKSAKSLGVKCTFGAAWKRKDLGHVQLTWADYPVEKEPTVAADLSKPQKTVSNSKTIAAAATGVPVVTFFEEIFAGIKAVTGGLLAEVDATTIGYLQTAALVAIVLFIVWERYKKTAEDGV